jgi:hypothetical protein
MLFTDSRLHGNWRWWEPPQQYDLVNGSNPTPWDGNMDRPFDEGFIWIADK